MHFAEQNCSRNVQSSYLYGLEKVVKPGYIFDGFGRTAQSVTRKETCIQTECTYVMRTRRMFCTSMFERDINLKNSFWLVRANKNGRKRFWVSEVFLLFRMEAKNNTVKTKESLSFIQYKDCIKLMFKIGIVLRWIC